MTSVTEEEPADVTCWGTKPATPSSPCHWPACKIVINGVAQCDEGRNCVG